MHFELMPPSPIKINTVHHIANLASGTHLWFVCGSQAPLQSEILPHTGHIWIFHCSLYLAKMKRRHVLSTVAARDDPTTFLDGRCGERWVRWWPSLLCFLVFWMDSCNHCKYQNDNNRDDLVGQLTMLTWQCTWHSSWLGFQDLQLDTGLEASHWKKSVCIARHSRHRHLKQVTEVYETFNLASHSFGL